MRCLFAHALRWRRGWFLVFSLLLLTPAKAESVLKVTWPGILRLVDEHPLIAASKHQADAARSALDLAGAVPNPTLEGTLGHGQARTGSESRVEWGMSLTLPLGWIAIRGSRIHAAQADMDMVEGERQELRLDVLLQLRTLFWNLVHSQAQVESLQALASQTAELVRGVKKRVERGEARPVEATRVEIELDKVMGELESARVTLSSRQAALALWLKPKPGMAILAGADLLSLPVYPDRDTALAMARTNHPTLGIAKARTHALVAKLQGERLARIPNLELNAFTTHELDRQAYGVGVAINVPVWSWNSGGISQAKAKVAASEKQALAMALHLDTQVIETQSACQASTQSAARLEKGMIPRAQATTAMMERIYQVGEATLLEVIDAKRTLLESQRFYLNALAQAQIDCSRLDVLIGENRP